MKSILLWCALCLLVGIQQEGVMAQDGMDMTTAETPVFFPNVPRSNQTPDNPSRASIIGISIACVLLVVLSFGCVCCLGFYEEIAHRNKFVNASSKNTTNRGARYRPPPNVQRNPAYATTAT